MASTDMRNISKYVNGTSISNLPITSAAPADDQSLVFDTTSGYWSWRTIVTSNTDQTINGVVTIDGATKIGTNGTEINRLNAYADSNITVAYGANVNRELMVGLTFPPFDTAFMMNINSINDENGGASVSAQDGSQTNDNFYFAVRNLYNSTTPTAMFPNALAVL